MGQQKFMTIDEIPYFDPEIRKQRTIHLFPFHHLEDGWKIWIPTEQPKKVLCMHPHDCDEAIYYAKQKFSPDDIHSRFIELIVQRLASEDCLTLIDNIYSDIQNLGATMNNLSFLCKSWDALKGSGTRMVISSLEYIFITCRSVFDFVQNVVLEVWKGVTLSDGKKPKNVLPRSFREMVLASHQICSEEDIQKKRGLPSELASYYARHTKFFLYLRNQRDKIAHTGKSFERVYMLTHRGLCISRKDPLLDTLTIWNENNTAQNDLVSLRSFCAYVIMMTFAAMEDCAGSIQRCIHLPDPIAPEYNVFLRSRNLDALVNIDRCINENAWWLS